VSLDAAQLLEFRTSYIRDRYVAATGAAPAITLSHYNRATKSNLFSDDDLQSIAARLEIDFAEELQGVYDTKETERLSEGDSDADATTSATNVREQALFRLMRAECRQIMMEDPGFVGSIADKDREELFSVWKTAIERDRTFVRTRTSALFASVPIVRL
jgi:hypothetical protein